MMAAFSRVMAAAGKMSAKLRIMRYDQNVSWGSPLIWNVVRWIMRMRRWFFFQEYITFMHWLSANTLPGLSYGSITLHSTIGRQGASPLTLFMNSTWRSGILQWKPSNNLNRKLLIIIHLNSSKLTQWIIAPLSTVRLVLLIRRTSQCRLNR